MSWEDGPPEPHPCPCREGQYTITHRSDDWGRFDERWEMQCPRCRSTYGLYAWHVNHKGATIPCCGWLPRPKLRELAEAKSRTEAAEAALTTYLGSAYGGEWRAHFEGRKKSDIWRELTKNGDEYPSLGTFYSHVRASGLSSVLARYLEHSGASTVIRVLSLEDQKLRSMRAAIAKLKRHAATLEADARQHAVT